MNKPTNVVGKEQEKQLPGVSALSCDTAIAQGKNGEMKIEYGNRFEGAHSKLEEEATVKASIESYIAIRDNKGEIYRVNAETGEPLICKGQDEKKVKVVVKEFKEAIKEVGLKIFNEMLKEERYVNLGYDNTIDAEQIKEAVRKYLKEKEAQEQEEAR